MANKEPKLYECELVLKDASDYVTGSISSQGSTEAYLVIGAKVHSYISGKVIAEYGPEDVTIFRVEDVARCTLFGMAPDLG